MVKYLIMDVDGTLTDGKIYIGTDGECMKAFSVKDGYVINYILKPQNIIPIVITARTSEIVKRRCDELGIKEVHQGIVNKLEHVKRIIDENQLGECAYFGDDILDLHCMLPIKKAGGIIGCPADAVREVKAMADYVCVNKAGEGALREFTEWLVQEQNNKLNELNLDEKIEKALNFLRSVNVSEKDEGIYVVSEDFWYSVQSYDTKAADECKLESHRRYVDIQLILNGSEYMEIADVLRLEKETEYDFDNDVSFWKSPSRIGRVLLSKGDSIILYPENAHRGGIKTDKGHRVVKLVGKVKL